MTYLDRLDWRPGNIMVDTTAHPQADSKRRIKKLTTAKLEQFRNEIVKRGGQQVDLTGRGIETIVSLEGLQSATKLDLSHNKLTKLSQLKSVARVTMLKLTDNKLNGDGLAEIQHLKKLVILNAAENNVTRIPFEVLRNVRTLKALVLNSNSISTLDWMPKLPELNSLIVSNNRIAQIPQRVVDGLPSLTKLSISHNLLEEVPNLSQLSGITELRLSHNRIKRIPVHLAQLKNLKVLELSHNQIDDWSGLEALSSLENLRQLNLNGNPIVGKQLESTAKESRDKSNQDSDNEDGNGDSCSDSESESDGSKTTRINKSKSKKAGISDEEKQKIKEDKRLDAKHKQYNFKIKRLFPNLVVRDAVRVLDKRVHGYVAPVKEEKKKQCLQKSEPFDKKSKKTLTGKRKLDESLDKAKAERKTAQATTRIDVNKDDVEKPSKKGRKDKQDKQEKKAGKKHKGEKLTADKPAIEVAATFESEKQSEHQQKQASTNGSAPTGSALSKDRVKTEKKRKKEEKKDMRQSTETASGVVAIKQLKKSKKAKATLAKAVDLTQINFTPDVGFGGSSAWD